MNVRSLVLVLVVAALSTSCGTDLGAGDPSGGDEGEAVVRSEDEAEAPSLDELRALVEQRAQEEGLGPDGVECVLDYLEETFDAGTAAGGTDVVVDEAFDACAGAAGPEAPLEPDESPAG